MLDFEKWQLAVDTRDKILSRDSEQDISKDIQEATRSLENGMKTEFEKYLSSLLLSLLISSGFPSSTGKTDEEMRGNCKIARRILKWEV